MIGMRPAKAAVFLEFKFLRSAFLVFRGRIITLFTGSAGKRDNVAHDKPLKSVLRSRFYVPGSKHRTWNVELRTVFY